MIRHLVFLRYKPEIPQDTREKLMEALSALQEESGDILAFDHRPNVSPEDAVVHNFRDMFWFDFKDAETRDSYLANSKHKAIGKQLVEATEGGIKGVFVCDIEL